MNQSHALECWERRDVSKDLLRWVKGQLRKQGAAPPPVNPRKVVHPRIEKNIDKRLARLVKAFEDATFECHVGSRVGTHSLAATNGHVAVLTKDEPTNDKDLTTHFIAPRQMRMVLDSPELHLAVRRAMILNKDHVTLTLRYNTIVVSARSHGDEYADPAGEFSESVACRFKYEPCQIELDPSYLEKVLGDWPIELAIPTDEGALDESRPLIFGDSQSPIRVLLMMRSSS